MTAEQWAGMQARNKREQVRREQVRRERDAINFAKKFT